MPQFTSLFLLELCALANANIRFNLRIIVAKL